MDGVALTADDCKYRGVRLRTDLCRLCPFDRIDNLRGDSDPIPVLGTEATCNCVRMYPFWFENANSISLEPCWSPIHAAGRFIYGSLGRFCIAT